MIRSEIVNTTINMKITMIQVNHFANIFANELFTTINDKVVLSSTT